MCDFEDAFLRAVNLAVECFVVNSPIRETDEALDVNMDELTSWNDVFTGYDTKFHEVLNVNGLLVESVDGDGYCLFHAVAVGLGRSGEGMLVFEELMDVMESSRDEISEYVDGSVDEYLSRLKRDGYGDELEIRYMKEIYGVEIIIWTEDAADGAITGSEYPVGEDAINISYRNGVHYDAVVPLDLPRCPSSSVTHGRTMR
jgi:hypothetical protein